MKVVAPSNDFRCCIPISQIESADRFTQNWSDCRFLSTALFRGGGYLFSAECRCFSGRLLLLVTHPRPGSLVQSLAEHPRGHQHLLIDHLNNRLRLRPVQMIGLIMLLFFFVKHVDLLYLCEIKLWHHLSPLYRS